jgi:hypothetical protein
VEDLGDAAAAVGARQELTVTANLLSALGDPPGIGLESGIRYHLTIYGIWGFAMISSPSWRSAIDIGLRYLDLTFAFTRIAARDRGEEFHLVLDAPDIPLALQRFVVERDSAVIRTIHTSCSPRPSPSGRSAVQSFGNLAASAIAGLLWTLASPRVAFGYLVTWMLLGLVGLLPAARDPLLEAVDLHGAHDFRHTFTTWLEDAGIPARVIDEVMGHEATSRAGQQRGSAMGAHYRHTTREMAARIAAAIEQRLTGVLRVAEQALEAQPHRSTQRVL